MGKTHLQRIIENSVKKGNSYPLDTQFLELENSEGKQFIDNKYKDIRDLSEAEIKTTDEALISRLAHMDYEKDLGKTIRYIGDSKLKFCLGFVYLSGIELRNDFLRKKAVKKAYKENNLDYRKFIKRKKESDLANMVFPDNLRDAFLFYVLNED